MSDRRGVIFGGLSPHPPIIVPDVGGDQLARVRETADALRRMAAMLVAAAPRTVVLISPHGPGGRHAFAVQGATLVRGDLAEFGAPQVRVELETDPVLLRLIRQGAEAAGIDLVIVAEGQRFAPMDYASLVPLHYLIRSHYRGRVILLSPPYHELDECYRLGQLIASAAEQSELPVAVLASGDLSHRLKPGAPAGYNPRGREYDRFVVESLAQGDHRRLLAIDPALVDAAGECGLRPILVMLGAISGRQLVPHVLSYEGPFGVGYAVVSFSDQAAASGESGEQARSDSFASWSGGADSRDRADRAQSSDAAGPASKAHPLVSLARLAIETYVRTGDLIPAPDAPLASGLPERAGTFVSLHRGGALRGCIGTVEPSHPSLAAEVIHNAVAAATDDPRFDPLGADELADLELSVDVLYPPEPVTNPRQELDPKRYGVIVERAGRRGLLLPDLDGVETPGVQISIAARKAGIDPRAPGVKLLRFRVERYH